MVTDRADDDEFADFAELLRAGRGEPDGGAGDDPRTRRARRRRRIVALVVVAVLLAAGGGYTAWALTASVAAPSAALRTPAAPVSPVAEVPLATSGTAAIGLTGADGYFAAASTPLATTRGSGGARVIGSITKLITALVVLEARPLKGPDDAGPRITFSKADHDLYDKYYVMNATIAPMPTGVSMSERDALSAMLIPSACNYAEAMARWAYGSQGAFLVAARRWLSAHGMTDTTIVEPTGVSHRNTSTPHDLLTLGGVAAANPAIAAIAATPAATLPGAGAVYNTNGLLGRDGVTGLKTGNLGGGTYALLYTASLEVGVDEPVAVTGVILGGDSRGEVDSDTLETLEGIQAGFHTVDAAHAGDVLGTFTTPWGGSAQAVVGEDASVLTWSDTPVSVSMTTTTTPARYADGEVIGTLTVTAGPQTATAPIRIAGTIAQPTAWWRLTHPFELAPFA
ncbi:D-alanyl-D-alanine carboxypeptidase [Microbacterium luticocti]|uniref:D-alanyl-D-alanine carboxypeptidase n=1 Tax=Microbacterium luticocti TaxID=451764 RepID=UPI000428CEE7|nr:D-alanyl-D-alanine carboxypeptidase [Microbacterium luticocti]